MKYNFAAAANFNHKACRAHRDFWISYSPASLVAIALADTLP